MFSYVSLEERVPAKHPLRAIRQLTDRALRELSADFDAMYSQRGRPSIPPEQLLRALVLQCLYSIRSERQLMEQIDYNLLYRWFVGLAMDAARWDETVFTKNRDRLIEAAVAHKLLAAVLRQARQQQLLSAEHFTVDGTLLEASANRRSFVEKEQPDEPRPGMRGKRGLNEKVGSKTDPDARLYRKSHTERSKPAYLGHVLTDRRVLAPLRARGQPAPTRITSSRISRVQPTLSSSIRLIPEELSPRPPSQKLMLTMKTAGQARITWSEPEK